MEKLYKSRALIRANTIVYPPKNHFVTIGNIVAFLYVTICYV